MPVNVDIKDHYQTDELIQRVHQLIKKYNRQDLVVWGSFNDSTCKKCYTKDPNVPLIFSMKRVVLLILSYYTGLLPFLPIKESFLEIPMFATVPFPFYPRLAKVVFWILKNFLGSPRLFNYLNRRGITVFSWVQNDKQNFEFCYLEKKVNGMMTDCPMLLTDFYNNLKARK